MIVGIILLVLILGVSVYININLLKRNETLEETYEQLAEEYDSLLNKMARFENIIDTANKKLNDIDHKGSFSSDDEVGFFFKELKSIQEDITNFLK